MASVRLSLLARMIPGIMRLRGANKNYLTREHVRRHLADLTLHPRSTAAPRKVRRGVSIEAEFTEGWRVYSVQPERGETAGTVVYLHGGGWIHEAASAHWALISQIALEAGVRVLMPVYPLAHEGGNAANVVPRVVQLCENQDGPIILMGDSAGGSIAMSAALQLAGDGDPVALTVLISPALDLRFQNPQIEEVQPIDPWLVRDGQIELAEMWLGDHGSDPILNPINGELKGVGPLLIFSGTRDILNPDTRLFVDRGSDVGADISFHEQPGLLHVYPLLPLREARRARNMIVTAIRNVI